MQKIISSPLALSVCASLSADNAYRDELRVAHQRHPLLDKNACKERFYRDAQEHWKTHGGTSTLRSLLLKTFPLFALPQGGSIWNPSRSRVVTATNLPLLYAKVAQLSAFYGVGHPLTVIVSTPESNAEAISFHKQCGILLISTQHLQEATTQDIDVTLAHEMGHIAHNHVPKGTLATLFGTLAQGILTYKLGQGVAHTHAALKTAIALTYATGSYFTARLAIAFMSRAMERQADHTAGRYDAHAALASAHRDNARYRSIKRWDNTHPTQRERVAFFEKMVSENNNKNS